MSETKQPIWPLIAMLVFYGLLLIGSGALLLLGLAFGSEAYRSAGIPLQELLLVSGPLIATLLLIIVTVLLWNAKKYTATYIIFGVSLLMVFGMVPLLFGVAV
ncbi:MAG: hypothetical protein ABJP34_13140 [Erythrobacter sp.]